MSYNFQIGICAILLIITFIFRWLRKRSNYWSLRDIPHVKNTFFSTFRNRLFAKFCQGIYQEFRASNEPFVGFFSFTMPSLLLLDLDLIKRVLITDFEYFNDRGFYHNERDDPLSVNLTRLKGEKWKKLRSKITPAFSSGKLKSMFPIERIVAGRLVDIIRTEIKCRGNEIEIRDLSARFTTDVIGTVALGIECNSLRDPQTPFRLMGEKAWNSFLPIFELFTNAFPELCRRLRIRIHSRELLDFYCNVVDKAIKLKQSKESEYNDFMDMMLELTKTSSEGGEPILTTNEMIGQIFMFLIAGFETSSSSLSYCLYELSLNPEIQEKARTEVLEVFKNCNNHLTREYLKEMVYLNQIFQETLRLHPIGPVFRRIVTKSYQVPGTNFHLEKGLQVFIPVYAIHHDSRYYPEPEKFNPENFLSSEIQKRHIMSHLPFGAGPRTCIAERFGREEVLLALAMLLKNFRFSPSARTPTKLQFDVREKRILRVKQLHLNVEEL